MSSYNRLLKLANRFEKKVAQEMEGEHLLEFKDALSGYIDAMGFIEELSEAAMRQSERAVEDFITSAAFQGVDVSGYGGYNIGHDFWLARNRSGGFSSDDYSDEDRRVLREIAQEFEQIQAYLNDDGMVHLSSSSSQNSRRHHMFYPEFGSDNNKTTKASQKRNGRLKLATRKRGKIEYTLPVPGYSTIYAEVYVYYTYEDGHIHIEKIVDRKNKKDINFDLTDRQNYEIMTEIQDHISDIEGLSHSFDNHGRYIDQESYYDGTDGPNRFKGNDFDNDRDFESGNLKLAKEEIKRYLAGGRVKSAGHKKATAQRKKNILPDDFFEKFLKGYLDFVAAGRYLGDERDIETKLTDCFSKKALIKCQRDVKNFLDRAAKLVDFSKYSSRAAEMGGDFYCSRMGRWQMPGFRGDRLSQGLGADYEKQDAIVLEDLAKSFGPLDNSYEPAKFEDDDEDGHKVYLP